MTLTKHTHYVYSLILLPNGDVASVSTDNTIRIWNTNDCIFKKTIKTDIHTYVSYYKREP